MPKMILACEAPMILEYIPYGKHKGKRFVDVAKEARGDLHYMQKSESLDQDVKASIEHACKFHSKFPAVSQTCFHFSNGESGCKIVA